MLARDALAAALSLFQQSRLPEPHAVTVVRGIDWHVSVHAETLDDLVVFARELDAQTVTIGGEPNPLRVAFTVQRNTVLVDVWRSAAFTEMWNLRTRLPERYREGRHQVPLNVFADALNTWAAA